MERPARRRYVSLCEGQELLTPFECLPLAVTDVLFKHIDVTSRIRLMSVSRAVRAIVDRSADIDPLPYNNNILSIRFINTDISEGSVIGSWDEKDRLLFTVRASVTFAGQTAAETFRGPLENYYGRKPAQETPFLDRCIARIMKKYGARVTDLHVEGRPPIKLGQDVLPSNDFLPAPVCLGMHLLTSLRTIRITNMHLFTPGYYAHKHQTYHYRLLKHPVHLFYSHYSPITNVLQSFMYRQFTALSGLTIAPNEFAQPTHDVVRMIRGRDKWRIPVIDIPIDLAPFKSASRLKKIATGCEQLRLSINMGLFRDPSGFTRQDLEAVDCFFQKLNDVENVAQIYVYNIPLRNACDVVEFHRILQNVRCGRMIVGSIRRTRADKTAWEYGCQHADTPESKWIVETWKMLREEKEEKKCDQRMHDRVEKWREGERRRKLRSATRVWVQASWDKFEKKWADKEREKERRERRKKAWRPVLRVKRSRALVKALAKLLHADVEPFRMERDTYMRL